MSSLQRPASNGDDLLYSAAKKARENAYSPYSQKKVGAALRTKTGSIYSGCNIENSSYGATNCAERVAIQTAIASEGQLEIQEIVVVTEASPPWPPCGMCRQVIAEFAPQNQDSLVIKAINLKGETLRFKFSELIPHAFTPNHLHP